MELSSFTGILMLATVITLVALVVYAAILNTKKNKIFKNMAKDNCIECGKSMLYYGSPSYTLRCPDCKTETMLLLDENKKVIKLGCRKISNRYRNSWILIFILIYAIPFACIFFVSYSFGYVIAGLVLAAVGIFIVLGVVPLMREYSSGSLNNINLKYSVTKMRLIACGLSFLCAILLVCRGMEFGFEYLAPLLLLLSIYTAALFFISEHNVISEKITS